MVSEDALRQAAGGLDGGDAFVLGLRVLLLDGRQAVDHLATRVHVVAVQRQRTRPELRRP